MAIKLKSTSSGTSRPTLKLGNKDRARNSGNTFNEQFQILDTSNQNNSRNNQTQTGVSNIRLKQTHGYGVDSVSQTRSNYPKSLNGIEEWEIDDMMEFLNELQDERLIEELYEYHQQVLFHYVMNKYYGKIQDNVIVLQYGKLQEFYVEPYIANELSKDTVLSYVIKYSEFIKNSIDVDEVNGLRERVGVLILRDLPDQAYEALVGDCTFETYEYG